MNCGKSTCCSQPLTSASEKAWEHQGITEDSELDKQLKRLTPDGSDLWFQHYNTAADLIKQQLIDQCKTVITTDNAAEKLEIEASSHCDASQLREPRRSSDTGHPSSQSNAAPAVPRKTPEHHAENVHRPTRPRGFDTNAMSLAAKISIPTLKKYRAEKRLLQGEHWIHPTTATKNASTAATPCSSN